ncbi:hypothetical protein SDC9_11360 [bioreactor metagenome]|uniref:MurNAc-LAA domain-containing protein n=1 Tax=bioreactor metagenome TaxID=1076179 RepID=A0A644TFF2_9ZZZZ|nr:N-acetylmuramoyl-L-alanine amidase [Negativicutes bacterium]
MYRMILSLLLALLLLPQLVLAAPANSNKALSSTPAVQIPVFKSERALAKVQGLSKLEITNVRYALHKDAVTGEVTLRMVIDATGPIKGTAVLNDLPVPRLEVAVGGASLGKLGSQQKLDGKIASQVKLMQVNGSSKLVIDLENMIDETDYRIFALPRDIKADKPYRLVVDIKQPAPPIVYNFTAGLKGKVIALDPGHGGSDPGAIGPGGSQEKTVTLAVAKRLQTLLEKAGAKVVMTRQGDRDVYGASATAVDELKARTTVAAKNKADVFISLHADAFTKPEVGGTSTFYYRKSMYDGLLAKNIQTNIIEAGKLSDRRVNSANFYVVKRSVMPAALVEMAFITNPDEEKLLNSPQFQQKMAQGIYQGLDNFFVEASRNGGGR